MYELINEPIEVFAAFTKQGIEPICFTWRDKEYDVKSINFIHTSKSGDTKLIHFAITSGADTYRITLDSTYFSWRLEEIYTLDGLESFLSLNDKQKLHKSKYKNVSRGRSY